MLNKGFLIWLSRDVRRKEGGREREEEKEGVNGEERFVVEVQATVRLLDGHAIVSQTKQTVYLT